MNTTIKFELTIDQTNIIFDSLSRMPYQTVVGLIAELQKQAQAQIQPVQQQTVSMPMPNTSS